LLLLPSLSLWLCRCRYRCRRGCPCHRSSRFAIILVFAAATSVAAVDIAVVVFTIVIASSAAAADVIVVKYILMKAHFRFDCISETGG
jgi:hypothetical protein